MLVDQEQCRSWRMCVSGCPYKKVYFNWQSGKAEKCTLCYPRLESGQPTICSETCVGRIRYLGVVLYDADRVAGGGIGARTSTSCSTRSSSLFLDPNDPDGPRAGTRRRASPRTGSTPRAARPSGARDRAPRRAAAPSRVPHAADGLVRAAALAGDGDDRGRGLGRRPGRRLSRDRRAADPGRVPREHAHRGRRGARSARAQAARGDARATCASRRSAASPTPPWPRASGSSPRTIERLYRLLAIAKYDERYVIPKAHTEVAGDMGERQGACGISGPTASFTKRLM